MGKAFTATWLGDGSPEAQIINEGGLEFIKGRPVTVPADHTFNGFDWAEQIRRNPMFEVGTADEDDLNTSDDDAEVTELREMLDGLGVKYAASAKAPALRAKLDEATK
jgi:hypothetical protein